MSFSTDDFIVKIALQVDDSQLKEAVKTADKLGLAMGRVNNVGAGRMTRPTASERDTGVMGSSGQNALSQLRFADIMNTGFSKLGLTIGGGLAALLVAEQRLLEKVGNLSLKSQLTQASPYDLYLAGFVDKAIGAAPGSTESLANTLASASATKANKFKMGEFYQARGVLPQFGVSIAEYDSILNAGDIKTSFAKLVDLVSKDKGRFTTAQLRNLTPYFGEAAVAAAALTTPNRYRRELSNLTYTALTPEAFLQRQIDAREKSRLESSIGSSIEKGATNVTSPAHTVIRRLNDITTLYSQESREGVSNAGLRAGARGAGSYLQTLLEAQKSLFEFIPGINKLPNNPIRDYLIDSLDKLNAPDATRRGIRFDGEDVNFESSKDVKIEKLNLTLNVENINKGENNFTAEFGVSNDETMATVVFETA